MPAIIEFSRTDEEGLGSTAHEVLKEISTKHPDVFKAHVQDLCKAIESEAPTAMKPNGQGAVDDLKACAGFARKFPKDLPKDRKFLQSLISFALYGTPPKAAKHAVTIIMSIADKKEMHAKDILSKCTKDFQCGSGNYLSKLAALSQLILLARREIEDDTDPVIDIAINHVLLQSRNEASVDDPEWIDTPDEDLTAKVWALKILINSLRAIPTDVPAVEIASPVYKLLNVLVAKHGELSKKGNSPAGHKSRLRLLASQLLLKLSCTRHLDSMLTPSAFNALATVAQDPCTPMRIGFVNKLMKYLGQGSLHPRFFSILFLMAFEPDQHLKDSVVTWVKSQRTRFEARKSTTLETVFARLISLLAHHPDFDPDPENLKDFVQYIIFYLKCVANPDNLSLIYHVAQRVKGVADGITSPPSLTADENLYVLSDLAQAVIRQWEELQGWSMQAWPGKLKLPGGIFKALESHEQAQEVANKVWIGEKVIEGLEGVVRGSIRAKKRKNLADDGTEIRAKKRVKIPTINKVKPKATKPVRTPKKSRRADDSNAEGGVAPSSETRRRSGRKSTAKSYVEQSDDEDDVEMEKWQADDTDDEVEASETESQNQEGGRADEDEDMAEAEAEVEQEEEEEEEEEEAEPESEPAPKPAIRETRTRGAKKSNGVTPVAESKKKFTPVAVNGRGKAKVNGKTNTTPKTNIKTRGRARGKASVEVQEDDEALTDPPESDQE